MIFYNLIQAVTSSAALALDKTSWENDRRHDSRRLIAELEGEL